MSHALELTCVTLSLTLTVRPSSPRVTCSRVSMTDIKERNVSLNDATRHSLPVQEVGTGTARYWDRHN